MAFSWHNRESIVERDEEGERVEEEERNDYYFCLLFERVLLFLEQELVNYYCCCLPDKPHLVKPCTSGPGFAASTQDPSSRTGAPARRWQPQTTPEISSWRLDCSSGSEYNPLALRPSTCGRTRNEDDWVSGSGRDRKTFILWFKWNHLQIGCCWLNSVNEMDEWHGITSFIGKMEAVD